MATHGEGMHDSEVPAAALGGKVSDTEYGISGRAKSVALVSKETSHRVGEDEWYTVGFHIVAALNTAFVLGYPALIMANLGWTAGVICIVAGGIISFYNNCLLGDLHETGGKRHVRYRDLAGHIYGRHMYITTWFFQYSNLFIAITAGIILSGESLKLSGMNIERSIVDTDGGMPSDWTQLYWWYTFQVLNFTLPTQFYPQRAGSHAIASAFSVGPQVTLPGWVGVAGAVLCIFAFMVPTLHSLKFFSACSLLLSCIFTFIGIGMAFRDGVNANGPRDYSLKGSDTNKAFNALGALSSIAFAFNTGILPEMQATVKEPSSRNMKKALGLQFTVGTFPILVLTFVGYWAYGKNVSPYLLNSAVSSPKSALIVANVAAFLQSIVSIHIYASPIFEFMDTRFVKKGSYEWSPHCMIVRLVTRTTYIALSTFLGALLPFFGDFVALTGALAAFSLEAGLVHHMYLKVRGKKFGRWRLTWHWGIVIVATALTCATVTAGLRFIIVDSIYYHVFANIYR